MLANHQKWRVKLGKSIYEPEMEHIEHAVSVHPHRTADGRRVGPVPNRMDQLAHRRRRHLLHLLVPVLQSSSRCSSSSSRSRAGPLAPLASHARLDVDARLGGVARLARVERVRAVRALAVAVGGGGRVRRPLRIGPLPLRMRVPGVRLGGRRVALLARGVAGRGLDAVQDCCCVVARGRVPLPLALRGRGHGRGRHGCVVLRC